MTDVTQILNLVEQGDSAAEEQLLCIVYDELKRIAAAKLSRETPGHTLQTTALVNEAYLRLIGTDKRASLEELGADAQHTSDSPAWDSRGHFFSAAAEAMRRILIDSARKRNRLKRGGDRHRVFFDNLDEAVIDIHSEDIDLDSLDGALTKLEQQSPDKATVVKLRYFAGMTIEETAAVLGTSTATIKRTWSFTKAWLRREMENG